jgi:hypothetical protein
LNFSDESAAGPTVGDLQVVVPAGLILVQLEPPAECFAVVAEAAGEALAKTPGGLARSSTRPPPR